MNELEEGGSVSRETLRAYVDLLQKWNPRINLIGGSTAAEVWTRHIEDSLRVVSAIAGQSGRLVDLGSGGGLPGVVIAIARSDLDVTLIESDARKSAFLQTVRRELRLSYGIEQTRIEAAPPHGADIITARALAPLSDLLALAVPHATDETHFVFPKGRRWRDEVEKARRNWDFSLSALNDADPSAGPILMLQDVRHRQ